MLCAFSNFEESYPKVDSHTWKQREHMSKLVSLVCDPTNLAVSPQQYKVYNYCKPLIMVPFPLWEIDHTTRVSFLYSSQTTVWVPNPPTPSFQQIIIKCKCWHAQEYVGDVAFFLLQNPLLSPVIAAEKTVVGQPNNPLPSRSVHINALKNTPEFDVLVIGGGASGCGVALDAVTRGKQEFILNSKKIDLARCLFSKRSQMASPCQQGNLCWACTACC